MFAWVTGQLADSATNSGCKYVMLKITNFMRAFVGFDFRVGRLICVFVFNCSRCFQIPTGLITKRSFTPDAMSCGGASFTSQHTAIRRTATRRIRVKEPLSCVLTDAFARVRTRSTAFECLRTRGLKI